MGGIVAAGVARHGQTVRPGEPEVGHDQIRLLPVDQRHRFGPGVSPKGCVTDALKEPLAVRDEIRLVIDDQDWFESHGLLGRDRAIGVPRSEGPNGGPSVGGPGRARGVPWGTAAPAGRPCPTARPGSSTQAADSPRALALAPSLLLRDARTMSVGQLARR